MPQRSRWALPVVVNPPASLCVLVSVPNEQFHIAAFLGAIYELTRPYSWENDVAHTAIQAGAVWQPIFDALVLQACASFNCPVSIEEWEDAMSVCESIRFNPATGLFEGLCCGSWSALPGQPSGGFGTGGQPGGGTPQPAPNGGCQTYHMTLNGRGQAVLPYPVNTGDTVIVSNMRGSWYDGSGVWNCPAGGLFFAGLCGPTSTVGSDPLPGSPHMALLTKVGGVFHNISDGALYTIPAAISNLLLIFQANDSPISDDGGDISFDVTVCNNQSGAFHHVFDFTKSSYGFTAAFGTWTPGVGFVSVNNAGNQILSISRSMTARTLTRIEDIHNMGAVSGGGNRTQRLTIGGVLTVVGTGQVAAGVQDLVTLLANPVATLVYFQYDTTASAAQGIISYAAVDGIGADPF